MNHEHAGTCTGSGARTLLERGARGAGWSVRSALVMLGALGALGCSDIDAFLPVQQFGGPAGVLDGTLTYSGPPPCTEDGRIVGAAVLFVFDVRLLPPPEGLGTSAGSVGVVTGETLFAGVRNQLTFNPDGTRWCPVHRYVIGGEPTPSVTVSAPWAIAPLAGGTYQVRGFYDLDGDFDPGFKISNLPTKGDIGGGAIENASQVLAGKSPRYRELSLGDLQPDGSRVIGAQGDRIEGIAVTLGLELPLERPIFYPKEVIDDFEGNDDPQNVVMRSDVQLDTFSINPAATEKSFIRLKLGAGVPADEAEKAAKSPFNLPVNPGPEETPPFFLFTQQDVNGDGKLNGDDHVPESALLPSLYPLSIFSKLVPGSDLVSQPRPAVVLQGLTLYKGILQTAGLNPGANGPPAKAVDGEVIIALRPAALCLDPADAKKPGLLVVSHETDTKGNKILADQDGVKAALGKQFGRPIEIAFGCLPEGRYAMNLIYPTGQAWTVPNEAAVCAALEPTNTNGTVCGTRPRLASQGATVTVGLPKDASYCSTVKDAAAIRSACIGSP